MNKECILQVVRRTQTWGFDMPREVAVALDKAGFKVVTIFFHGEHLQRIQDAYPGTTEFPNFDRKRFYWRILAFFKLLSLRRKYRVKRVFCHHYKPSVIFALIDRLSPLKQLFMLNHNAYNLRRPVRRLMVRYLFSSRWCFLGVSKWIVREFHEQVPSLPDSQFKVLYNCLHIDAVIEKQKSRDEARSKLSIPDDAFVFGNIHRLVRQKGQDYLIEAFASVADQMPGAHLVIIGDGYWKDFLVELINKLSIQNRVHLAGMIPDASSYATAFDVFISASIREGFGLGMLEGMAARLPTITSTGGATPEIVGDTGLHFEVKDKDTLAAHMVSLYNTSPEQRQQMGEGSFNRLQACFCESAYHQNVAALFNRDN